MKKVKINTKLVTLIVSKNGVKTENGYLEEFFNLMYRNVSYESYAPEINRDPFLFRVATFFKYLSDKDLIKDGQKEMEIIESDE